MSLDQRAESRDVHLETVWRGRRWGVVPELIDEHVTRDDLADAQQKRCENHALLRPAKRDRHTREPRLERPEQPKLERLPICHRCSKARPGNIRKSRLSGVRARCEGSGGCWAHECTEGADRLCRNRSNQPARGWSAGGRKRRGEAAGTRSATPQEQRFYMLTATLKPRFVTKPPVGTSAETVGRFSAQFDRNFREEGGHALYPRLRFTGLTGPATAVHIHVGRAGTSGRELAPLCGPNISPASHLHVSPEVLLVGRVDARACPYRPSLRRCPHQSAIPAESSAVSSRSCRSRGASDHKCTISAVDTSSLRCASALTGAGSAESVTQFHRTEIRGFTASLDPVVPGAADGSLGGKITVVKGRSERDHGLDALASRTACPAGRGQCSLHSFRRRWTGARSAVRLVPTPRERLVAFCTPRPWFAEAAGNAVIPPLYIEVRTGPRPARMLGGVTEPGRS